MPIELDGWLALDSALDDITKDERTIAGRGDGGGVEGVGQDGIGKDKEIVI